MTDDLDRAEARLRRALALTLPLGAALWTLVVMAAMWLMGVVL